MRAIRHEGFSLVDVLQPCVTFNNTYELYNKSVTSWTWVPSSLEDALGAAEGRIDYSSGDERDRSRALSSPGDRPAEPCVREAARCERAGLIRKVLS